MPMCQEYGFLMAHRWSLHGHVGDQILFGVSDSADESEDNLHRQAATGDPVDPTIADDAAAILGGVA